MQTKHKCASSAGDEIRSHACAKYSMMICCQMKQDPQPRFAASSRILRSLLSIPSLSYVHEPTVQSFRSVIEIGLKLVT